MHYPAVGNPGMWHPPLMLPCMASVCLSQWLPRTTTLPLVTGARGSGTEPVGRREDGWNVSDNLRRCGVSVWFCCYTETYGSSPGARGVAKDSAHF